MLKLLGLLERVAKFFHRKTEQEKITEYLSQAVDRYHLEILEKEYFGY